jgi:UDP-glucose 4-epimerase
MVIPRFVSQALADRPLTIYGDGTQSRCFTYVGDSVRAIVRLMEEEEAVGEVVNVGGNEEVTILESLEKVGRLIEWQPQVNLDGILESVIEYQRAGTLVAV